MSRRLRLLALAGLIALGSGVVAVVTATGASADTQICDQYGTTTVGGRYIVQNNRWGTSATQCINVTGTGFSIVQQDGTGNLGGAPVSYPSIYLGCHYGNCSPGSPLPREAGVSIATASRVLNNSTKVSAEAYRSVCEAASRLGYRRHRAAWGKAHRKAPAVAAVIHAGHHMLFTEPFFARFIGAAELELAQLHIPLLVTSVTGALIETVGRYLQGGHIDGIIIVSDHGPLPLSGALAALGVPIVAIGRPLQPCRLSFVDADNRGGARKAVEYLIAKGRRAIAHIAAPPDTGVGADRLAGYREAMRAVGATDTPIAYGDWSQASGAHAMQRLLDQRPALDAVFVASDVMAAGALRCLVRAGRRIPDGVALVGFDDHSLAQQVRPALTTVRQPIEEFAAVAVRRLLAMIQGGADDQHETVLPTRLILRESA